LVAIVALAAIPFVFRVARAEESGGLDWSAWQRMPVLQDGRIMPMDSFARATVKKICGDAAPRIGRLGTLSEDQLKSLSPAELQKWISENRPRRFLAAELLYAWTVGPQKWADVSFLFAPNEQLRRDVLQVPLIGEDGSLLTHVSPRQASASSKLRDVAIEAEKLMAEAEQKKQIAKLTAVQQGAFDLAMALGIFEKLSFDPARDHGRSWLTPGGQPWLASDVAGLMESWGQFNRAFPNYFEQDPKLLSLAKETDGEVLKLADAYRPMQTKPPSLTASDENAGALRRFSTSLAAQVNALARIELPENAGLTKSELDDLTGKRQALAHWADSIASQAAKMHWSLYDAGGQALFVAPALEPAALEADRHRGEISPWISIYALLEGSPTLLHGYPPEEVTQIRAAWQSARDAYLDRSAADRGQKFSAAMQRFTSGVRSLATEIEPLRAELPIIERDKGLLAKTAYPSAIYTDAEVAYNEIEPFHWAMWASLAAGGIFGLSLVVLRKQLFWLGTATLVTSVLCVAGGFAVRIYITHWAPVTSMVETIVWVTMWIALLTLWGTFLPLLLPASKTAWALTAIPGTWESKPRPRAANVVELNGSETPIRAAVLALRLVLFIAGLYIIGVIPGFIDLFTHGGSTSYAGASSGGNEYSLVSLWPRVDISSKLPGISSTLVWLSSLFVAGTLTWYLPRLIPSALMAIAMSATAVRRPESAEKMEKIYSLRAVAMGGALASFLAALAANYAPFPRDISALMPVLRSNFWLGIHVLTEVTSYAFIATAWCIGNIALIYYAFGRYRTVQLRPQSNPPATDEAIGDELGTELAESATSAAIAQGERRPPAFCGTLANLTYRVMQVAVLLITAGTILGGLWADVSWGRFWGWDSKEVGALIALLILLTAVHGRRAGWPGDLTLAIGSIFGFLGVMWAWYVVNWLLPAGMHSYGAGEGGRWLWLILTVGGQFLLVFAAVTRVSAETGQRAN
jgi:ABC-type transport system involved in cytochrome c biogenesis permease subunit